MIKFIEESTNVNIFYTKYTHSLRPHRLLSYHYNSESLVTKVVFG